MQRMPPEMTANARRLRSGATDAEQRLWRELRRVRPRFTRQLVLSHYILDFACRSLRLAIEIDGGQHAVRRGADTARNAYLQAQGWTILRFWNHEVLSNPGGVMAAVLSAAARASTHPQPLPFREGG